MSEMDTVHEDIVAILNALGLGDHARPYSAHMVVHREIIPAIQLLRGIAAEVGICPVDGEPMPCLTCGAGL